MTVEGMRRVIVRRPPFEMALGQTLDSTQNITTCCCLAKGKTSLNVNFEANAYTPYEVAKCFVEVNNRECSIPIESVTFKLKRKVWAQAKTGQILNIPDATMTTATFPGAAAFQDSKREHWSLDLNKAREANPLQMLRQRPDKKIYPEEDFALQREPLQASALGQIVQVKYWLEILCNYGGLDFCRTLPACHMPLTIYAHDLTIPPQMPPVPQGWAP